MYIVFSLASPGVRNISIDTIYRRFPFKSFLNVGGSAILEVDLEPGLKNVQVPGTC